MTRSSKGSGGTVPADEARVDDALALSERQMLGRVNDLLSASDDLDVLVRNAVEALASHAGYGHVGAYQLQDGGLHLLHQVGYDHPVRWLDVNSGICGRVARNGRGALVEDVDADGDYVAVIDSVASEIAVPFGRGADASGVLNVEVTGKKVLTEADFRVVSEIADLLTHAIQRSSRARARRSSQQRLHLALDAASVGTWSLDPTSGVLEWMFASSHSDIDPDEAPIQSIDDVLARAHAGDFAHLEHAFSRALIDGDLDVEFRMVGAASTVRWLNMRGLAVDRAVDGTPLLMTGAVFDVTGRKRLEEERLRLVHLETARTNAEHAQRTMATTIERLRDGFVAIDGDLNVTLVNEEAARLFAVDREELLGVSLQDALARFGDENATANFFAACTALEPSAFDAYDPRSDRFLEVRAYPGGEGTTLHLRDVTELRRAEYERQRSEARFRSLVQEASDLILILDRQAVIQFASPAVVRTLGMEPWEIVGRDDALIVHPADDKRFRRSLVRILRTPGIHSPFEVRVRHRDGSYRWLEITPTNLLSDPLIRGVVANCRDITERHASEFNLWLTSEVSTVMGASLELDQTLESLNRLLVTYTCEISLVAVFNERGEVERHAGAEREPHRRDFRADGALAKRAVEAIGVSSARPLSSRHTVVVDVERLDLEEASGPYAQLGSRMKELDLFSAIIVPIVLRGQVRGLLMVGFGQDTEITPALISMIEDIARRAGLAIENAGLYQHAREAIEARDRFLSVTAHELRTPITSVTGYSKMLMRELRDRKDPERIGRYAGRLDEAGQRLATLAEDLLDVSRIRSGQLPLRIGPVDLGSLAGQIAVRYTEHRSSARDRICVQVDEPSPLVSADPDRLEQVVTNIIDNALKYSPPQTTIDLLVTADNHDAMVVIRDQGMGVAPESLEAIFEPFGRGGNVEETGITGLGLGLYICRTIVERLGGTIRAESDGEGTGLTVTVRLPLIAEAADAE